MKKHLLILTLSFLSLQNYCSSPSTVIPVSTVTTLHQDYLNQLLKKIDAALVETQTEVREKALKEIYNEITSVIAAIEAEVGVVADDTLLLLYILKGLENKVNKAKRSIDFECL